MFCARKKVRPNSKSHFRNWLKWFFPRCVHYRSNPASQVKGGTALPNRPANLVALILVNLLQNALQATPRGRSVVLFLSDCAEKLVCEVRDEGPGFPDALADNLFSPCKSTKEGGSGIGLAISKQLANHLGATLELRSHSPTGCVFVLSVPANIDLEKSKRASPSLNW